MGARVSGLRCSDGPGASEPSLFPVRYFVEQHESQLQRPSLVKTVAGLVSEVWRMGAVLGARRLRRAMRFPLREARMDQDSHTNALGSTPTLPQMNYQNKHLVGAMIVAGYDAVGGAQVYGCPIGGTLSQEDWTLDGSGSTYIWGYLDAEYRCVQGLARAGPACDAPKVLTRRSLRLQGRDEPAGG